MQLDEFLGRLKRRRDNKLRTARQAYIRQGCIKSTKNCVYSGRQLQEGVCVCKISAMGNNQFEATTCWDEKAPVCPCFKLKHSKEDLKKQFNSLPDVSVERRWPSLGELNRIIGEAEDALDTESFASGSDDV